MLLIFYIFNIDENNAILPIGISFYSFQLLSYQIDSIKNNKYFTKNFKVFYFYWFFPQLIAGPIMRAKNLIPQIQKIIVTKKIKQKIVLYGFILISIGLIKKFYLLIVFL